MLKSRTWNEKNADVIRRRAYLVEARLRDMSGSMDDPATRPERETELLGAYLSCTAWVLKRAYGRSVAPTCAA